MKIVSYGLDIQRELLKTRFGFKGGYFTEKWITLLRFTTESGLSVQAPGGLSILWSDPAVFTAHSEVGGNLVMSLIAEYAAKLITERSYEAGTRPDLILKDIFPPVHRYACQVAGTDRLRRTFTLNGLVSVDFALWLLYARARGDKTFDEMIPEEYAPFLSLENKAIAHAPLLSYGIGLEDIRAMADGGIFLFKVKLGQGGTQEEMLEKDRKRLSEIHAVLGQHSRERPIYYYLDANGRYGTKDTLMRLMDHMDEIRMLDQVLILEEPFDDGEILDVGDVPVAVAADETIESVRDLEARIDAGYRAFAIKPAGKTLSASLEMIAAASSRGLPCFVADSACVPRLLDWNRNVAARLPAFPEMGMNFMESNGADHYKYWDRLIGEHPFPEAAWLEPRAGLYHLDEHFYASGGGIWS